MHAETVAALVRSQKQIMRCEKHLAEIHRRLQATSCALAKSLEIVEAHGAEAAPSWHPPPRPAESLARPFVETLPPPGWRADRLAE